jgi:hypothetical protein
LIKIPDNLPKFKQNRQIYYKESKTRLCRVESDDGFFKNRYKGDPDDHLSGNPTDLKEGVTGKNTGFDNPALLR